MPDASSVRSCEIQLPNSEKLRIGGRTQKCLVPRHRLRAASGVVQASVPATWLRLVPETWVITFGPKSTKVLRPPVSPEIARHNDTRRADHRGGAEAGARCGSDPSHAGS